MNEPIVFSGVVASRGYSMAYPFYSIRAERTELLGLAREFLRQQGIVFTEQTVPGIECEEVGFLIAASEVEQMVAFRTSMPAELRTDFMGWVFTPPRSKIPVGMMVPDECFHDPLVVLQATAESDWFTGQKTMQFLNVETDEVATVDFDYDRDTYVVDRDVSKWRHAFLVPSVDS